MVLEVKNVTKSYSNHIAVNDLSFNVPKGCIFGMLGPNGAGKTSLIRIITGITQADAGEVVLDGGKLDYGNPLHIGYMPEERGLYKNMKVGDHLLYLAQLKGLSTNTARKEMKYWLEKFEIASWKNKKVQELSKGMQQKIQFIGTVIHQPPLLILDEPFSGLDPINSNLIKDEIFELKNKGTSIILSTHRMEQVEAICEQIVLINQGQNVLEGKVRDVKNQFKEHLFTIQFNGDLPDLSMNNIEIIHQSENKITIKTAQDQDANDYLMNLMKSGLLIQSFEELLPTVNEIFIKVVGENNQEQQAA